MRFLVVFLFTASLAFAGSLEELKSRLEALKGGSTVSARLEIQVSGTEGEGDEPTLLDGRAGATVGEDSKGVTITYDAASVERAEQETASHGGGSRSFGARFALSSIEARDVHELLNAAPFLLRQINRGELVSEKDDRFDGHPAHLLVLKVNPKINPQAKRFIKDFSVTANIWLGSPRGSCNNAREGRCSSSPSSRRTTTNITTGSSATALSWCCIRA